MCQVNNYKNALPAGRLIPIVSNYPNEIVTLDLLGPYPVSRVRRNRYVLVITDHFSKWAEIIPLKKALARVIADESQDGKKKGKKSQKEETVTLTTSGYNLRPRNRKRLESRPTIERKTQQGGPVRSRKGRGRNDGPTSKSEQDQATRIPDEEVINNGKTRRRKERVRESLSLEVLVGNANYKS
ncbi:retrovirus-related Pol polyprotein from transposon 17.6 [Trichonephila clavipes]|nr:retrovirus-related Pol polyprotein from transposon 17.6 [Trichonephila clavipes]